MVIKYCPRCHERYIIGFGITDYVHECNSGNLALDQEDVVVVGSYEDGNGNLVVKGPQEVLRQGSENELQGTRADIECHKDKEKLTRRGFRASTRRQKQHGEFININEGGLS
jgi:hypothetical protein